MATRAVATRTVYVKAKRRGHRARFTVPLAVVAGFMPMALGLWGRRSSPQEMGRFAVISTTGYDYVGHRWTGEFLGQGIGSILLGMTVHTLANRFGINRAIGRMLPIIRL